MDQASQNKPWDLLVFIGRFQPLHQGHLHIVSEALQQTKHLLILIGSSNRSRSVKNPFTFNEREQLFKTAVANELANDSLQRITFSPLADTLYNDRLWQAATLEEIDKVKRLTHAEDDRVAVVGYDKDESSYYLSCFPQLGFVAISNYKNLSATPFRESYLRLDSKNSPESLKREHDVFPAATCKFLEDFKRSEAYESLVAEQEYVDHYRHIWRDAPYPPVFVTVDALVRFRNECLFIRRGNAPAKGLLAMPGGFLDPDERAFDGAVRELREETALGVSYDALHRSLVSHQFFDHPSRSVRKRTVTQAFYFDLSELVDKRPMVSAQDDAADVCWLDVSELESQPNTLSSTQLKTIQPESFAEDHFFMLAAFLFNWPAINPTQN